MATLSVRERAVQTFTFEAGGLLLATPLYNLVFGGEVGESFVLLLTLSIVVVIWSSLHNTAFDHVEWRLTGRLASERPHALRLVHAVSHEASAVTLPLLIWLGGHDLASALLVNVGLTAIYTA